MTAPAGETVSPDVLGFLPAARALSLRAARRVMELLKDPLVTSRKEDRSLVTNADHAANDIIRQGLREAFPDHAVFSEETGREGPAGADYVWLVDPLDGTKAYARNVPGFSVMVGLLHKEKPVLGVVADPWEGSLYEAVRGAGCYYTHQGETRRARVSERSDWAAMPAITSTGFPEKLRDHLQAAFPPLRFLDPLNSVGVKVGVMVRGDADVYVNHHPVHYWDTCAPLVILEEAGGVMTLWDGSPLAYPLSAAPRHAGPTAASNGPRHAELLKVLAAAPRS
ncbi:MAG: inositol monophosphatase family protein [Elusimicrobiota bacterium]